MTTPELAAGYRALVEGAAAVELDRDVIAVDGADATSYLQGQMSQDVAALAVGVSAWSLILQPQGKIDAWVRVTRAAADRFILDVDAGWAATVVERLNRFKLRAKIAVEVLDWRCVAVRGSRPPATLEPPGDGLVAAAVWPLIGGLDLLGPDPHVSVPTAGLDAYEVRRIEAGLPRMGAELTERTIPAEAPVVETSVSFTKGCYTGQELVARIDSRGGQVPRRLVGATIAAATAPEAGAPVVIGEREVGVVTSAAAHPDGHAVALVSLRRDVEVPAEASCGGAATRLGPLPLLS